MALHARLTPNGEHDPVASFINEPANSDRQSAEVLWAGVWLVVSEVGLFGCVPCLACVVGLSGGLSCLACVTGEFESGDVHECADGRIPADGGSPARWGANGTKRCAA